MPDHSHRKPSPPEAVTAIVQILAFSEMKAPYEDDSPEIVSKLLPPWGSSFEQPSHCRDGLDHETMFSGETIFGDPSSHAGHVV